MESLKYKYAKQDNRGTRWPIYVTVQELIPVGVFDDGYSVIGDGETHIEYPCEECGGNCMKRLQHHPESVQVGYVWQDIEFFLTIDGANNFIALDKHNHGKLRTYVKHFSRRNFEMNNLLSDIGFKVED
jgi:hypothetical protein